jgi:transcriptional regulator with GAF, ATPase, and Fis domain
VPRASDGTEEFSTLRIPGGIFEIAEKIGPDIAVAASRMESESVDKALFLPPSGLHTTVPPLRLGAERSVPHALAGRQGPLVCNDLAHARYAEEKELYRRGYRSSVAVGVDVRGWGRGAALFASRKTQRFDALAVGELIGCVEEWILEKSGAFLAAEPGSAEEAVDGRDTRRTTEAVIGESPEFLEICRLIAIVARQDTTVLIQGESGTGKELLAKTIHRYSARSDRPFVRVNCAAIAETLLESEMFGHRKGAFTGAIYKHKGRFEVANGGTLLLDEIGNMPMSGQAKLLRVLQEFEFEPVGETSSVKVDVRIIATTNVDLKEAIERGRFRQDLYYRLAVAPLEIPPLRDRSMDVLPLAEYFLSLAAAERSRARLSLSEEAREVLRRYDWPGNARELKNAIDYAVLVAKGNVLGLGDLPASVVPRDPGEPCAEGLTLKERMLHHEKAIILEAMKRSGGVRKNAARILGIDPRNLNYFLNKHGIR